MPARCDVYLDNERDGFMEIGAPHHDKVGDVVFSARISGAGEYIFIDHPRTRSDSAIQRTSVLRNKRPW